MPIAAAIRTHRRRAGSAGRSSAALRRLSRLPETVITQNAGNPVTNTWSYNRRRLPTAETQTPDGTRSWSLTYGYNPLGQRTSETAPDNVTTTYTVNALGQTTQISVKVKTTTTTVASNASYYPNGALQQFTYGNGITHTLTQNARQLPQHSQDGSVLDLTTTFDANGNVASIVDGTANARQSRSMAYDGLDRLTQVLSPMFGTASYSYDEQDNLRHVAVSGGNQPRDHTYCYGADNRLEFVRSGPNCTGTASPAVIALGYDPQGNLQYKNGTAYSFDYGNRLRSTANQSYRYDAAGRRVRTDSAGSQLQYSDYASDGRLVWQRDEAAGKRINNIYLAGSLVAEVSRSLTTDAATYRYVHTDALGSPIAKTSSTGAVIETSEYEPYGQLLNRANDDRAGYTGHVMDSASGLIYMQQRYYDPQLGIFDSVDPVTAYSSGNWRQFNRYAYAYNNPYKFTDPDGRCPTCDRFSDNYAQAAKEGRTGEFAVFEKPAIAVVIAALPGGPLVRGFIGAVKNLGSMIRGGKQTGHTIPKDRAPHIFRESEGHLRDTPQNRETLQRVADDPKTTLGTDRHGNTWSAQQNKDGSQTWTQTRNGEIRNAGVNETPRTYNPETGLSRPVRPDKELK